MIPLIYSLGTGRIATIIFDPAQRLEIILTIVQSYLGFLFLASMDFCFLEAVGLFALWLIQFLMPGVREEIVWVYGAWALFETFKLVKNFKKRNAFNVFLRLVRATY